MRLDGSQKRLHFHYYTIEQNTNASYLLLMEKSQGNIQYCVDRACQSQLCKIYKRKGKYKSIILLFFLFILYLLLPIFSKMRERERKLSESQNRRGRERKRNKVYILLLWKVQEKSNNNENFSSKKLRNVKVVSFSILLRAYVFSFFHSMIFTCCCCSKLPLSVVFFVVVVQLSLTNRLNWSFCYIKEKVQYLCIIKYPYGHTCKYIQKGK